MHAKTKAKNWSSPHRKVQPVREGFWASKGTRETVESIVVAFILAFLFRTFEAEAFVIPTGSMAPTLMGRHKDVYCPKCGFNYRASASEENPDNVGGQTNVVKCSCPTCAYEMDCNRNRSANEHDRKERTYNGDRILVSKFSYQFGDPKRWDVIVFKYPGNAKMNYIKRLVGLPNETLRIQHGDIFVAKHPVADTPDFRIARKPPHKLRAMLQLVHDNQYCPQTLLEAGGSTRWQIDPDAAPQNPGWNTKTILSKRPMSRSRQQWTFDNLQDTTTSWIRYGAFSPNAPNPELWRDIENGRMTGNSMKEIQPKFVHDHYEYNESQTQFGRRLGRHRSSNWVGDLAVEAETKLQQNSGHLVFKLLEGGHVLSCDFDLATGTATLSVNGGQGQFLDAHGKSSGTTRSTSTKVQHPGKYRILFANCDDQLVLWINGKVVAFDAPTTYAPLNNNQPTPSDHWPIAIGAQGTKLAVSTLRVYRDVFYIATDFDRIGRSIQNIPDGVTFSMSNDQFFVLGDNSPASKDSRLWRDVSSDPYWVDRNLLIGKALFIYWPHSRSDIFPFCPNIPRMGFVR